MGNRQMGRAFVACILVAMMAVLFSCVASAVTIIVENGIISDVGSTTTVRITLDEVPAGLSGYTITVSLEDPAIAEITNVAFPGWAGLTDFSDLPDDSFWMKAADLNQQIEPAETNIELGTLTIRGDAAGVCAINVTIDRMDDDGGFPIDAAITPGSLTVSGVVPPGTSAVFRVTSEGNVLADGTFHGAFFLAGSADVAEWVAVSESVESGDVLELDPESPGYYRKARGLSSKLVAGVVSTEPGFLLGSELRDAVALGALDGVESPPAGTAVLALVGIVPVKVTDEGGAIFPGDLLIPSSTPGYAMKWHPAADNYDVMLIGKALGSWDGGDEQLLILLMR